MEISFLERAAMMMPQQSEEDLEIFAADLEAWVKAQALVIRSLGRTRLTRAVLTLTLETYGVRLECMFYGERGDACMVEIQGNGQLDLSTGIRSTVPDAVSAHVAVAVLLDELEMSVVLG